MKKLFIIITLILVLTTLVYAKWPRRGQPGYEEYIKCLTKCDDKMSSCVHKHKTKGTYDPCRNSYRDCTDSCEAEYERKYRK